jgi:hypothetical protein
MNVEDAEKAIRANRDVELKLTYENFWSYVVVFQAVNCDADYFSIVAARLINGCTRHEWSLA